MSSVRPEITPDKVTVALVQMSSGPDIAENIIAAETMIREAAAKGAQFILTPENTCHIRRPASEKLKSAKALENHPVITRFSALAAELGVWIMAGSISVLLPEEKILNRSILIDAHGNIVADYDKIHLFDVDLPTGEVHRESAVVKPGTKATLAATPWGKLGMTICYDLRFANLFRTLAKAGAAILTVPAAFTVPTGQAHWHTLLRARAIENGAFVLAPAQVGTHEGGRLTYGHSLIIDPWGKILAEADGEHPGIIMAELDMKAVTTAREAIPALLHEREYSIV
jgi:predicted amidohydrolase